MEMQAALYGNTGYLKTYSLNGSMDIYQGAMNVITKDNQSKCKRTDILCLCSGPGGISFRLLIAKGSDYQAAPRPTWSPGQTHDTVHVDRLLPSHSSSSELDNLLFGHYLIF